MNNFRKVYALDAIGTIPAELGNLTKLSNLYVFLYSLNVFNRGV